MLWRLTGITKLCSTRVKPLVHFWSSLHLYRSSFPTTQHQYFKEASIISTDLSINGCIYRGPRPRAEFFSSSYPREGFRGIEEGINL
jgi:hypothetical protein